MLDIEADRVNNAVGTHNGGVYGALVASDKSVEIDPSLPLTTHELRIATWPLGKPISLSFLHVLKFDLAQF